MGREFQDGEDQVVLDSMYVLVVVCTPFYVSEWVFHISTGKLDADGLGELQKSNELFFLSSRRPTLFHSLSSIHT